MMKPSEIFMNRGSLNILECIECSFAGGPMLRRSDNAVIGVVSFCTLRHVEENIESAQVSTYIPHYYTWIKQVTGIDFSRSML